MDDLLRLPWTPLYQQSVSAPVSDSDESIFARWALAATVVFTVLVFAVEGYLDLRQQGSYRQTDFPDQLANVVGSIDAERAAAAAVKKAKGEDEKKQTNGKDAEKEKDSKRNDATTKAEDSDPKAQDGKQTSEAKPFLPLLPQLREKFLKSQAYGLDKVNFQMIAHTFDTAENVTLLIAGFAPYVWDLSAKYSIEWFGWTEADNEIRISLVFLFVVTLWGNITSLPFGLYSTFQIERKHGFNKQTLGLFFTDKIKSLLLTCAIGGPFLALVLYVIKAGGDYFYLYVWGLMFVFSLSMMTIIPVYIMPLFNKYDPLPDGTLKTAIYELADRLEFPLTNLFVMDGSTRSSHSNAFMFGFGKNKRIVLFDTLIEQLNEDEIIAVLGHELGHWKLGHNWMNFTVTQVYMGLAFYAFSFAYGSRDLYAAFGFNDADRSVPTVISLLLFFQTLWAPVDKLLSFVLTVESRRKEFEADAFSVDLGMSHKLQSGLSKIHLENLGAMSPDPWYSAYHYSHPPLVERLSAMIALDKKKE